MPKWKLIANLEGELEDVCLALIDGERELGGIFEISDGVWCAYTGDGDNVCKEIGRSGALEEAMEMVWDEVA